MFHISWNGGRLFAVWVLEGNLSEDVSVQRGLLFKFEMKVYIWVWGTCGAVFFSLSSLQTLGSDPASVRKMSRKNDELLPVTGPNNLLWKEDGKESLMEGVLNYLLWILLLKVLFFFLILNKTDTF